MTGDLYPTPTRLDLLDQVDAGRVYHAELGGDFVGDGANLLRVTVRLAELEAAGWVERPALSAYWRLTDAGRVIRDRRSLS